MENCLVTKLKGSVDNYDLSFFDSVSLRYVQIENPSALSQYLSISAKNGPVIVEALDGGFFTNTYGGESIGSTFTVYSGSSGYLYVSNNTCRIILHNKQNISIIGTGSMELCKDFDYANRLESMSGVFDFSNKKTLEAIKSVTLRSGSIGNLKNIPQLENLINLDLGLVIGNGTFSGSLEDLSGCRLLETLRVGSTVIGSTNFDGNILSIVNNPLKIISFDKNLSINGDFEKLAQCLILYYNKYGNIDGLSYAVSNSGLGGSVQAFVNACVDGGVTSGTVQVNYFKSTNIYSDLDHTLYVKYDPSIPNNPELRLSWNSDKTWTIS